MSNPIVIYIHGFLSSPQSAKAQETKAWLARHRPSTKLCCPVVNNLPDLAATELATLVESFLPNKPLLIGSSMGGFYSAWLSAKYDLKAVLVNPAVYIDTLLQHYLGENTNPYSGQTFELTPRHIDLLAQMNTLQATSNNLYMLLQTGDETLDYRNAVDRYPTVKTDIEQGGNHRFENFEQHLPRIMQFLEQRK